MPIFDLYSYRQRSAKGELPDVFIYDDIPRELRVQIIYIWSDAIGVYAPDSRMRHCVCCMLSSKGSHGRFPIWNNA